MNRYLAKLEAKAAAGKRLCVGIDPDADKTPSGVSMEDFCLRVVASTIHHAAVYKINVAFFEAIGELGWSTLKAVIDQIRKLDPEMPIIGDAKRLDIGNTNKAYAKALFEQLDFDAITIHNYLGWETAAKVFTDYADRGIYVLCRTSNKGAGEFQDLRVELTGANLIPGVEERFAGQQLVPIYQVVAYQVATFWNVNHNCGLVVGATFPEEMVQVRKLALQLPLLVPGVGSQGGDLGKAIAAAFSDDLNADFVVNVSGGVLYAHLTDQFKDEPENFERASECAAAYYSHEIQRLREEVLVEYLKKRLVSVGAIIIDDHIVYTSGKHGTVYVNLTRALNHLRLAKRIALGMADLLEYLEFDTIAAPTHSDDKYAWLVADNLLGRGLEFNPVFAQEKTLTLTTQLPGDESPRNYDTVTKDLHFPREQGVFVSGKKVVILGDVLTTGGTVDHMIGAVTQAGGEIVAIVVACNRSDYEDRYYGYPLFEVMKLSAEQWDEDTCPSCMDRTAVNVSVGHGKKFLDRHGTDPSNWPANKGS